MTAQDYQVTFPFGATDYPYSAAHPHRGDDRPCPEGTPVLIGGTTIGYTGSTGNVIGAHLHIQEWSGGYSNVRKPQNAFRPGIVVNVDPYGTQGDGSFGKFISIRNDDGWVDSYCHLSEILVSVGQELNEGEQAVIVGDGDNWYGRFNKTMQQIRGRSASRDELTPFVGQDSLHMLEAISDSPEADAATHAQEVGFQAINDNWPGQIYALQDQLKASQDIANKLNQAVVAAQNASKADLQAALGKVAELTAQLETANDKLKDVQLNNQLAGDTNTKVTSIFNYFVGQFKTFAKYIKK